MDNKYRILIILVILYIVGALTYLYIKESQKKYIVFSSDNNLIYDGKWYDYTNNSKLNNKEFILIKNGKYYVKSKIEFKDNKISNNEIADQNMFGYKGKKISHIDYLIESLDDNDYKYIEDKILKENNINIEIKNIPYSQKYIVDLNNDQYNETIYVLSNNYDEEVGELFTLIFIKYSDNYDIIEMKKFKNEFDAFLPYIYIIDIGNDKIGEIIIKNTYTSLIGQQTKILSVDQNGKYELIFTGGKI